MIVLNLFSVLLFLTYTCGNLSNSDGIVDLKLLDTNSVTDSSGLAYNTSTDSDLVTSSDNSIGEVHNSYNESDTFCFFNGTSTGCDCIKYQCVTKCCPKGQIFIDINNMAHCKNNTLSFHPFVFNGTKRIDNKKNINFLVTTFFPGNPLVSPDLFLQSDGLVLNGSKRFNISDYCFDVTLFSNNNRTVVEMWERVKTEVKSLQATVVAMGMLISVPFLLATFLVYALIPELQNLHGKSLMCHVTSLSFAYIFLATVQLNLALPEEICHISAFCIQFFFLVSFLWLNVMCFDIWWTFSGFRGFRGSMREAEHKKFLIYCVYAWGVPLVISIITVITQYHPAIKDHPLSPKIGANKCFFDSEKAVILYFYGPVAAIIICNLILFIITAIKIIRIKRETAVLQRGDSRRHDHYENDKQRFNLYLKLFIVMGVNWVAEVLSFFAQGPDWMWIVTDLFNTLQGVLIFIIFVCKRHIWKLLKKRYYSVTDRPYFTQTSTIRTQDSNVSTSNDVQMRKISRNNDS